MRTTSLISGLAIATSLLTSGCSADVGAPAPPTTVRALLADEGATLAVTAGTSSGAIVARLWRNDWQDELLDLAIGPGELVISADAAGNLRIEDLGFDLAPIELSAEVFSEPTRLVDLRVELAADVPTAATTWTDASTATATTTLALQLAWSLEVSGRVTPLGRVTLAALPIELTVAGTPAHLEAGLTLASEGVLWSWAHLIELADLSLALAAATAPE